MTLVCDICGGKLSMARSGEFAVCENCGMEHSVVRMREKIQENKGTVRVDNTQMIDTYLEMSATALKGGNNAEAENYANKVIEIDSRSAKAWFYKGQAAGWQTTGLNNRYPESIVDWTNAYSFAIDTEKDEIIDSIKNEAANIGEAILQMKCNSFAEFQSSDNKVAIFNAIEMIDKQLGILSEKTEITVNTDTLKNDLSRIVYNGAVSGSNKSAKSFGPDKSDKNDFSWRQFIAAQDLCLELLDKAYTLCSEDTLCHSICRTYITIAETVRDSCSYKWQYDGSYVKNYWFNDAAKEFRTSVIKTWKKKQDIHSLDTRKKNSEKAIELYSSSCGEANRKLAIAQYWETHASEKKALESELAEIERKKSDLEAEVANNSDRIKTEQIVDEIEAIHNQIRSLGLFSGKTKKLSRQKLMN